MVGNIVSQPRALAARRAHRASAHASLTFASLTFASLGYGAAHAGVAMAHPLAAEPPVFTGSTCILTLDKATTEEHLFTYEVAFDDTELVSGVDVVLPDSKTHQFFAARGYVARNAGDVVMARADDPQAALVKLPHWMSTAELERVAAAVSADDQTGFTPTAVEAFDFLEGNAKIEPLLWEITDAQARVPITAKAAAAGVRWNIADVPLGVYQLVGYIFSPPYNGWAERSGMVRIVEEGQGPPALTIDRLAAQLFAGQGRRVRGCVSASAGSMLQAASRASDDVDGEFTPWGDAVAVQDGEFELCLPNAGRDAVLEVRFELRDPAGFTVYHRPLEALTLFARAAPCVDSEMHCCPAGLAAGPAPAGEVTDGDAGIADMTQSMSPMDNVSADGDASISEPDGRTSESAGVEDSASADEMAQQGGCQCAVGRGSRDIGSVGRGVVLTIVFTLTWLARGLARRRRLQPVPRRHGAGC